MESGFSSTDLWFSEEPMEGPVVLLAAKRIQMLKNTSMLMPVLVEPTFIELQMRSVQAKAFGIERISNSSLRLIPFLTDFIQLLCRRNIEFFILLLFQQSSESITLKYRKMYIQASLGIK